MGGEVEKVMENGRQVPDGRTKADRQVVHTGNSVKWLEGVLTRDLGLEAHILGLNGVRSSRE